jgi:hypothetical protein
MSSRFKDILESRRDTLSWVSSQVNRNCFTERRDLFAEEEIHASGHRPLQGRLLTIVPGKT